MLTFRDISRFRDPRRLWQRLVLYSKRISPVLRWQEAADFDEVWSVARTRTLGSEAKAQMLFNLARHSVQLDGRIAEIGVYRGGTAHVLAHVAQTRSRDVHLFDTFEGMPETDPREDLHTKGDFADTSLESVRSFLGGFDRVHFHKGIFPETVGTSLRDARFSLVHVDVDIFKAVGDCCEFYYPRMVPGGVMVFDDYAYTSCPGAKKATDQFFADKAEPILHLVTSQAIVMKLPS